MNLLSSLTGLFLCCFMTLHLMSQDNLTLTKNPYFLQFTINDGLPSNETHGIVQDDRGYIWIATDRGISRFDGSDFTNFSTYNGLVDNSTFKFIKGDHNKIYYHTLSGQVGYFINDTFYDEPYNPILKKTLNGKIINSIIIDQDGSKHITVHEEFKNKYLITPEDSLITMRFFRPNATIVFKEINNQFLSIHGTGRKEGDSIYIHTKNGLKKNRYILSKQHLMKIKKLYHPPFLIYATRDTMVVWNSETDQTMIKRINSFGKFINSEKGVFIISDHQNDFMAYQDLHKGKIKTEVFLKGASFNNVYYDKSGGTWMATHSKGIYYIPPTSPDQLTVGNIPMNNNLLIKIHDSCLWVAEDRFLHKIHLLHKKAERFEFNATIAKINFIDSITFINLWNTEVYTITKSKKKRTNFSAFKAVDHSTNYIWTGSNQIIREKKSKIFQKRKYPHLKKHQNIFFARILCLSVQDDSTALVGTANGLYYFQRIEEKDSAALFPDSILQNRIQHILKWKEYFIISTLGQGVLLLDKNYKIIHQFLEKDGLSSNLVNEVIATENYFYIATIKGIDQLKFNKISEKFEYKQSISRLNSIKNLNVSQVQFFSGKIYAVTNLGLLEFSIENSQPTSPQLNYLIQYKLYDQRYSDITPEILQLPYRHHPVSLKFSPIYFNKADSVFFEYRINQGAWRKAPREILLSNLAPKTYRIDFRASHDKNIWINYSEKFLLQINQPFWMEGWFILLLFFAGALILFFVLQRSFAVKQERALLTMKNHKSELKALRAQMNPHFLFNVLNSIQYLVIEKKREASISSISRFSRLIRNVLKYSGEEWISLEHEISFLKDYINLEKLRASKKFNFQLATGDLNTNKIRIPTLLLQPFVENAIWHGIEPLPDKKGILSIKFIKESAYLKCEIQDNGVGRNSKMKKKVHESKGLKIISDRLKIVNETFGRKETNRYTYQIHDLKDEKGNPAGTLIVLKLPVHEET